MKKRILSAIIMIIICVPIIYLGKTLFRLSVGLLSVLALREIIALELSHHKLPILVQIVSYITLLFIVLTEFNGFSILYGITYKGIALLLLLLSILSLFYQDKEYTMTDALFMVGAILLLGTSFNTMILVRAYGLWEFCLLLLIFILTDSFALFFGSFWGRHKLIPTVSPNKTIEGSIGGTLTSTLGGSIFYHYLINPINGKAILGILCLSLIGQFGDLLFSKIKRENKIKDFSNLIPGHGGILDRLDSTIAIMLGYLILYSLF